MQRLKFGICGLGFAGSVLMGPDLAAHPMVELVAACDPNEDVRGRFGADRGVRTYASLGEMIEKEKLDAVYIASPHQFHADNVVEAAARGLHIIVEKPLTITLADAERMVDAVEKAGVHIVVGPSRGNDPVVRKMRQIVQSGDVGRVAMVSCWDFTDFLYRPRRPEELDTTKGGGIVFNQLPHQIDCVKAITDQQIVAVKAHAMVLDKARPTEGACSAFLTLSGGAVATMVYSGYDHFDSDEFQGWVGEIGAQKQPGQQGTARRVLRELAGQSERELRIQRYGYGGPVSQGYAKLRGSRKQAHFGAIVATCEHADLRPSPDGVYVYGDEGLREVPADPTLAGGLSDTTIEELCNAVAGKGPVLRDARWGRETVRVCLAILESTRSGREVVL